MAKTKGYVEQVDRKSEALRIYQDDALVAGAGLDMDESWTWWSLQTRGRRVKAASKDDAYAKARESGRAL